MFRQPPSKFIHAAVAFLLWWNIQHLEGSDRNGRLLLEQKRIDNLQQIRRYPRTPLLVTSPCVRIEQVWNAARWMHCSNPKFLKFWMTMLSPQVKYHFLAGQMLFWNGSWHLEWYGFGTCLLKDSYFSPFAFPTHPLTKTTVAFETSGKIVHTMHTKCPSLLLRNHLYLRKWSAPSVYWRRAFLFLNLHRCMRNYRRYHLFFWWTGISFFFLLCSLLYCSHLHIVHKK